MWLWPISLAISKLGTRSLSRRGLHFKSFCSRGAAGGGQLALQAMSEVQRRLSSQARHFLEPLTCEVLEGCTCATYEAFGALCRFNERVGSLTKAF